jgi:hypothetical protein
MSKGIAALSAVPFYYALDGTVTRLKCLSTVTQGGIANGQIDHKKAFDQIVVAIQKIDHGR